MLQIYEPFYLHGHSNTTLVKVKLKKAKEGVIKCGYSNTTLVKVKFKDFIIIKLIVFYSNTTLVKVKFYTGS